MGEIILAKLAEHKEKLLFGFVVLVILLVVMQAPLGGANLARIDEEIKAKTTSAAGLTSEEAGRLIKQIGEVENQPIKEVPDAKVSALFFHDRSVYEPAKGSAWQLGAETFEKLPPLLLGFPGFPQLNDFDIPAGASPEPERVIGYVPRDKRKVILTHTETNEFKDGDK
ncbi:MAG: hypothetical protein IT462_02320 [Planctomycetes bacterium]|nr:hypothetical protein [Planctomycetota bacterium]